MSSVAAPLPAGGTPPLEAPAVALGRAMAAIAVYTHCSAEVLTRISGEVGEVARTTHARWLSYPRPQRAARVAAVLTAMTRPTSDQQVHPALRGLAAPANAPALVQRWALAMQRWWWVPVSAPTLTGWRELRALGDLPKLSRAGLIEAQRAAGAWVLRHRRPPAAPVSGDEPDAERDALGAAVLLAWARALGGDAATTVRMRLGLSPSDRLPALAPTDVPALAQVEEEP